MRLLRRLLAIMLFGVLGVSVYIALRAFSGLDPFGLDLGKVAGVFSHKSQEVIRDAGIRGIPPASKIAEKIPEQSIALRVGLVADSHSDSQDLQKALAQLKQANVDYVIGLGDYTQAGTTKELAEAKKVFDASGLQYFTIPGDHDFWANKSRGEPGSTNFQAVFGQPYQLVNQKGFTQILTNNANFDAGLSDAQMQWLKDSLVKSSQNRADKPLFVFVHQPLYHPTSSHIMGRLNKDVDAQRAALIDLFKQYKVSEVISGDLHFFGRYKDSTSGLSMTTVGAVANERNIQKPRFAILNVYTDNTYDIQDVEINQ